jgi:multidrug efflux pump subunit AcrB
MIRLSIRRPVAVAMLYIAVGLLGVSAWRNIPIDQVPDASFPRLTLSFNWAGASPETVEAFATAPIEAAVQQVKWVERITSQSRENGASITVEFAREADMNMVRLDLSERLAVVEESLPDGVGAVIIQPYLPREIQAQARAPVLRYTFTGPFLLEALYAHLDRAVAPELIKVPGVDRVNLSGGRARLLEIELDPERVAALGLSLGRVSNAIRDLNLVREAGAVRQSDHEWTITLRNRPVDIADVRQADPAHRRRHPHASTTWPPSGTPSRRPGPTTGSMAARGQLRGDAGPGRQHRGLADRVKARIDELQALNPAGPHGAH